MASPKAVHYSIQNCQIMLHYTGWAVPGSPAAICSKALRFKSLLWRGESKKFIQIRMTEPRKLLHFCNYSKLTDKQLAPLNICLKNKRLWLQLGKVSLSYACATFSLVLYIIQLIVLFVCNQCNHINIDFLNECTRKFYIAIWVLDNSDTILIWSDFI